MTTGSTAIVSHDEIDRYATETYGKGRTLLRIGYVPPFTAARRYYVPIIYKAELNRNGGAGATGLIKALAADYLDTIPGEGAIEWVCNHSRNTQLALKKGYIDLALTYERAQEELAASEGWSVTLGCAFHDHFLLAGPLSDPAGIQSATSITDALSRIAASGASFHSRADGSATMWKERSLWTLCSLAPWKDREAAGAWYQTSLCSPSEAVMAADIAGAYLMTDRSTLLCQTALQTIRATTVFFEPTTSDDVLMNSCYALQSHQPLTENTATLAKFVDYLFSNRGQGVIASFGGNKLGGFPFFAPAQEGFTASFLRSGMPSEGKWKVLTSHKIYNI